MTSDLSVAVPQGLAWAAVAIAGERLRPAGGHAGPVLDRPASGGRRRGGVPAVTCPGDVGEDGFRSLEEAGAGKIPADRRFARGRPS